MAEHAWLQPSGAHRWMVCPGSVAMEATCPDHETEAAVRGSLAHTLLAALLNGDRVWYEANIHRADSELLQWVRQVYDHVQLGLTVLDEYTIYVEKRIPVGAAFGCPGELWGTPDIVIVTPTRITVVDAKFGFVDVDVEDNPQLSLYTIGVAEDYGWIHQGFQLTILQPQATPWSKTEVLTREALMDRRARYMPKVQAALGHNAPLHPTDDGCRNCRAAGICPAYQGWTLARSQRALAQPEKITAERLSEILSNAKGIRHALNAAEEYALSAIALGGKVPGWKRVRAKAHRQWLDEAKAEVVLKLLAPSSDLRKTPDLLSPAQIEKKLGLPKRALDFLAPAPDGSPMLARDNDPRPALDPVFSPIEIEEGKK